MFKIGDRVVIRDKTVNDYPYLKEFKNKVLSVSGVFNNKISGTSFYNLYETGTFVLYEKELIPVKIKPCKFMKRS